jgi:hypothetical protein
VKARHLTERQWGGGLSVPGEKADRLHLRVGNFEVLVAIARTDLTQDEDETRRAGRRDAVLGAYPPVGRRRWRPRRSTRPARPPCRTRSLAGSPSAAGMYRRMSFGELVDRGLEIASMKALVCPSEQAYLLRHTVPRACSDSPF